MPMTLLEHSKTFQNPLQSGVVEIYARESSILRVLPFTNISGSAYAYNREDTLPGIGFRGINEGFAESVGVLNPLTESLVLAGGDMDVDKFLVETEGPERRATETALKIKAASLMFGAKFFKGSQAIDVRELDGLQSRLTGSQLIGAGSTSGGDALSLAKLDEAIDQTYQPTHIAMSKAMRRLLSTAARTSGVAGNLVWDKDEFGRQIALYNGLPILEIEQDNTGAEVLGFTEANPGGGSPASTSIYVMSLGSDTLFGIQSKPMQVTDLGEQDSKPVYRTRVEWYPGIVIRHPRAATRLNGIKLAAVVA